MEIQRYLDIMVEKEASDLFFTAGAPVHIKIEGVTSPIGDVPFQPGEVRTLTYSILNENQIRQFEETLELDTAYSVNNVGRFRINVFYQRGEVAMVIRYIKWEIPSVESLNLNPILKQLIMEKRGLILIAGSSGSGKSTTMASMIDYRNSTKTGHILTLEDPIEFIHTHKQSVVNQREVGIDTRSYDDGLRHAVRESPDVILLGEIRDQETMKHAMSYATTGHLCISTIHASNTVQALERIVNFFPEGTRHQLLMDLSLSLRAIVSQRLVTGKNDLKLIPSLEILQNSAGIRKTIREGNLHTIKEALGKSTGAGQLSFEEDLVRLIKQDKISLEEAMANADLPDNVKLVIKLGGSGISASRDDIFS